MSQSMIASLKRRYNFLDISAIFTVLAILIPTLWINFTQDYENRWLRTGLLVLFGVIFLMQDWICNLHARASFIFLAVESLIALTAFFLPPQNFGWLIFLFYVLSVVAFLLFPVRTAVWWVVAYLVASAIYLFQADGWIGLLVGLPVYGAGFVFFAAFAYQTAMAEAAREESKRLLTELQETHQQLKAYAAQSEALAVSEERNRLAREMHDTLGHRLTVAAVQLEGAQRLIDAEPARAEEMVGTSREQVRGALGELRAVVATLRSPLEADLGLRTALERMAGGFEQATGITVHLMLTPDLPDLPETHRLALYRTAQEALTNIQKHARASDAWLQLTRQDGNILLLVRDNGQGIGDPNGGLGFGLRGLRERAAHLGGDMLIEGRAGGGTQISIRLPLDEGSGHV